MPRLEKSEANSLFDRDMKILVLGASGMAGHVVALYLQEQGYNVIAYTRQPFQYCEI